MSEGLHRIREALWERLRHETDPDERELLHTTVTSTNPAWLERVFRLGNAEAPPPVPEQFQRPALFFRPQPEQLHGEIQLGRTEDGYSVAIGLDCVGPRGDVIVAGVKGSGKSTLLKFLAAQLRHQVGVFVFDTENEYASSLCHPSSRFLYLPFTDYRRNILWGPPNVPVAQWLEVVKNNLREDFQLDDPAINILAQAFDSMQRQQIPLNLPDLLQELNRGVYRSQSQKALLNRLTGLRNSTGDVFGSREGIDFRRVENASIVFDLERAGFVPRSVFYHDMYIWFQGHREFVATRGLQNVWIFDEAHTLFSRIAAGRNPIGEPLALQMFRMARKRGIGFIVGDQIPTFEHPIVRGNIGLKIIFRLGDYAAVQMYAHALGLTPEQQNLLMNLPDRVAVVHHPRIPKPFLVEIPTLALPELGPDLLRQRRLETIRALDLDREQARHGTPAIHIESASRDESSSSAGSEGVLSVDAASYLASICREPFLGATERDEKLGLSKATGNALRRELLDAGMVTEQRVRTGRKGGLKLFELTTSGEKFLQKRKAYVAPRGKGGLEHRYWQDRVACAVNGDIECVLVPGGKCVDVGVPAASTAYEIVISDLGKELINWARDRADGWNSVIFCMVDEAAREALQQKIYETLTSQNDPRPEFRLLREFLRPVPQ